MTKTRLPQRTARHPINYDWGAWEEKWALMFDASRHALPNLPDELLEINGVPVDPRKGRLPQVDPNLRLTPLEFEFFDLFFIRRNTIEQCRLALEINWHTAYKIHETVKRKLADIVEER